MLRCIIDDAGPEGEVTIHIDDKELSLAEFGRMLRVHAGWGMRIAFVPEEFTSENPKVEIRKPKRRKRRRGNRRTLSLSESERPANGCHAAPNSALARRTAQCERAT